MGHNASNVIPPRHQQANGKADSAVKNIKTMMIKTMVNGKNQYEALMEQRNTPRSDSGLSSNDVAKPEQCSHQQNFTNKRQKENIVNVLTNGQSVYF